MISERNAPRLLGAAYLFVLVVSAISGALLASVVGPGNVTSVVGVGNISDILAGISENVTLFRVSILTELATSTGIVALAVLLYLVLNRQSRVIALVALGLWLAEAITLAVSKIGAFALIPLSQEFVAVGAPDASHYQTLGGLLYFVVDRTGYDIHMWFFGLGGMLWYLLFYRSGHIPRVMAAWGILSVIVGFAGTVLTWLDVNVNFLLFAQIAVFELTIGLWLLIRGIKSDEVP